MSSSIISQATVTRSHVRRMFETGCFIWAQLDLIFKTRSGAESIGAVTIATDLMCCHGERVENKESEDNIHTHTPMYSHTQARVT